MGTGWKQISPHAGLALAAGVYAGWACLLFADHASILSSLKFLYAFNPMVGALGVFVLSRRWLAGWTPAVLAGLLYGFGPFGLSFIGFHPVAGLTFAMVPWSLWPAANWQRGRKPNPLRFAVRLALCALPFAYIVGFFWLLSRHWVGPVFLLPRHSQLVGYDFAGLLLPLSLTARPVIVGLYHAGLPAALMGLFVYLTVRRVTVIIPAAMGLVLAFLDPVFRVSPVVWTALPMVFAAILAGLGVQSLLWAGKNDAKWLLACIAAAGIMAGVGAVLYFPDKVPVYQYPAVFYGAFTAALGVILLLSRLGVRAVLLRMLLLTGVIAADCFLSGRWILGVLL